MRKPFILFGAKGKPTTSMAGFIGDHYTTDEALAQLEDRKAAIDWAEIVVMTDDGPQVIRRWPEPEKE